MSLKMELIKRATNGEKLAPLCREFGISRTTAHKWLKRFKMNGYEGLEDESRRPKTTPLATAEDIVLAVLDARDKHASWGPRTIALFLKRSLGDQAPSERTTARILKRAGKVRERRRRRPPNVVDRAPHVEAVAPNDVWTVDFKGWWRARNGERCEPLTVRDACSRFVLAAALCSTKKQPVQQIFERLFRKYGVPKAIQCDNGVPFVSVRSRAGLSSLSAWWVSLGIRIVRSRPSCPQDNGGHERMHRDMSADVQNHPASTSELQQRDLDRWRQQFNHIRPHQALGGKTPAELYTPKERRPAVPRPYRYPPTMRRCRVDTNGNIRWAQQPCFVSQSLCGYEVGIEFLDAFHIRLWFHDIDLGRIEIEPEVTEDVISRWVDGSVKPTRKRKPQTIVHCAPQTESQVTSLPPKPPLVSQPDSVASANAS